MTAPARRCGPGAVPRQRLLLAGVGDPPPPPPLAAAAGRAGTARAVARAKPSGQANCSARCGSPGRRSGRQGDRSLDCIAIAGLGTGRPDVGGGGSAGAVAALARPPRAPWTVWARLPSSRERHPGLPLDPGLPTLIRAVPASSRYRGAQGHGLHRVRRARIAEGAITGTGHMIHGPGQKAVQVGSVHGPARDQQWGPRGQPLARATGPCQSSCRWGH